MKEANDEVDTGMQFHLTRYAYLFESSILSDGITLVPKGIEDGPGLKPIMESIDNRSDFRTYVHSYKLAHHGQSRGPRREGPADQGFVSSSPRALHYFFVLTKISSASTFSAIR